MGKTKISKNPAIPCESILQSIGGKKLYRIGNGDVSRSSDQTRFPEGGVGKEAKPLKPGRHKKEAGLWGKGSSSRGMEKDSWLALLGKQRVTRHPAAGEERQSQCQTSTEEGGGEPCHKKDGSLRKTEKPGNRAASEHGGSKKAACRRRKEKKIARLGVQEKETDSGS